MTTDTFPKAAMRRLQSENPGHAGRGRQRFRHDRAGFGDHAILYITDAKIPAPVLQRLLKDAADRSFNSITVDSDTSTSDTMLLAATGQAKHPRVTGVGDKHLKAFRVALREIAIDLATQVVRDGEGAQKFVTIDISGAKSAAAARRIGLAVANSPLVKTAIAGGDPNWGRIVMAVGKAGEKADRDRMSIGMGGVPITVEGQLVDGYDKIRYRQAWPDAISLFPLMSVLGAVRRGSGLATSPTTTSKSMRIIGRERSWRRNLKTPSLNSQRFRRLPVSGLPALRQA